ncbi:hypothetical protein E4T43_08276 [Aureobasidium subglaciale]|nr:hypothetical protein E4T43_08276 [Aureobasidium subglaciale]
MSSIVSPVDARAVNAMSVPWILVKRALPGIVGRQISQPQFLTARDDMVAIPAVYYGLNSGPDAGTVVGATLGSVAGFILLVWLIQTLASGRNKQPDEEIIIRHERSPRRRRRSEMRSVSRGPDRVIRQERIIRDSSRAPPMRSSFVVEPERRVEGDDIVEVIEEQSSVAPRKKSHRGSGTYRSVDPLMFDDRGYTQREMINNTHGTVQPIVCSDSRLARFSKFLG